MKKEYIVPEIDVTTIRFQSMMDTKIIHSYREDFEEGGEEGPDS